MTQNNTWCADFFDDLFAEHHLVRDSQDEISQTISFLIKKLHLKENDLIFDQCCGVGSLSIPLAQKGYRVHGVDLIPSYIDRARDDAGAVADKCFFTAGDAYVHKTPMACDAAVNWWTSFGYTPDDGQNALMLKRVHDSLKKGAWFALDYMNAPQRLKAFAKQSVHHSEIKKKNCTIAWESRLDAARGMIVKKWIYKGADGKTVEKQGGGVKIYTQEALRRMFETCGFSDISFYGSVMGEKLQDDSPRCIVVARKE